ncbi:ABC-2 type transporter [Coniochaeta sp. 2T2.1]|nr:ABC-2 type transporter [Coniochaeta sp. 2T2.1]
MTSKDVNNNMSSQVPDHQGSEEQIVPVHEKDTAPSSHNDEDEEDDSADATAYGSDLERRQTFNEHELSELQQIATNISRRRSVATGAGKIFSSSAKELDPNSTAFDLEQWLKHFIQEMSAGGLEKTPVGFTFQNLGVSGSGQALQLQQTLTDVFMAPFRLGEKIGAKKTHRKILHGFNASVKPGELLVVLGRPGSGCSTFLKSVTGELHGLEIEDPSSIQYGGISQKQMVKEFGGELVYNQEVDKHFPHLTVGQTLEFATATRTPQTRVPGTSRPEHIESVVQVVMAMCGLTHTRNTKVGNDFIRGVSGGERKRVSIAEMIVAGSSICAWDNSTRGLDSATAYKFVHNLRLAADLGNTVHVVAIYQASQAIYDIFDKATVLYEGRQIYFGPANKAKAFFERQGWVCPSRQTTADFLTAVTNPIERTPRPGMENKVPQTPEEFEAYWRASPEFADLQAEIEAEENPAITHVATNLRNTKTAMQAKHVRPGSSYLISVPMQVGLATKRAYRRIWNDKAATATQSASNIIIALIVGSLYYNSQNVTSASTSKVSVLFIAILCNALTALAEITDLYGQRPIVEKQASYRFIHPAAEAIAGIVSDIPIKFIVAVCFNVVLYFLAGLKREPGAFFLYFLVGFIATFTMSAVFRTMAAITKTIAQALSLAGVLVLALVIYTGFVIAPPQMHPWFGWIRWINPVYYAFEILVANEFHNREIDCSVFIPGYPDLTGDSFICSALGAVPGQRTVSGDAYIAVAYEYYWSHVWRNFGILVGLLIAFMLMYFVAIEINSSTSSTAEMLVFQRGKVPESIVKQADPTTTDPDPEKGAAAKEQKQEASVGAIEPQKSIFTWRDVHYDVKIKDETRTLLDNVDGWVKPGTLTALMGVSGAGKTTLLDVLAQRTTMGVITGDMFVNGKPLDASFQRSTGYVQQQDLHLQTSTVRESLRFSAMLRRPQSVSTQEKYDFVEEVIRMLNMEDFADAVVGVPGEGLNVEQRKLLTIGVELAAKPKLLLFLDEPTSGLDSQSSWAICSFLRKLADAGQAILCTIHQPSATLFQEFDRLLFLAKGGKTVYFGDIGPNSDVLLEYFERNGARHCGDDENPAEYMLDIVNKGSSGQGTDWHEVWKTSLEARRVREHIDEIHAQTAHMVEDDNGSHDKHEFSEFAAPFSLQLKTVTVRMFQQYWRMPAYVTSKWILGLAAGLFIGFSFYQSPGRTTQASMFNVMYGIFMVTTIFTTLVQQIQPLFVTQRALYEVRERPSKAYSWKAFMIANMVVEIPYQIITGIITFACVYYPTAGIQSSDRQVLVLLYFIQFFVYASTFAHMTIAALPNEQTAAAVNTLLVIMSIMFSGVLQPASAMPGFWIFMYRVSPFTYWIGGMVATELHARPITCSESELSIFSPPSGMTCGQYLAPYLEGGAPGQLQNPGATVDCHYCPVTVADQFLAQVDISWDDRWRNWGLVWAYVVFNVFVTITAYWFFRVRKSGGKKGKSA